MERFVIFPKEIHISHSMKQTLKLLQRGEMSVTVNRAFVSVINQCGSLREAHEGAWLGDDIKRAYIELHHRGYATSVEVWDKEDNLIGGLYGVTIGKAFIGESMFSLQPSASKVALIMLAKLEEQVGGTMIDCQFETPHLKSMGGRYISYEEYLSLL